MPTTAKNVFKWKKIEMDAQKLLIWEVQKQICFMRERSMDLKEGDKKIFFFD